MITYDAPLLVDLHLTANVFLMIIGIALPFVTIKSLPYGPDHLNSYALVLASLSLGMSFIFALPPVIIAWSTSGDNPNNGGETRLWYMGIGTGHECAYLADALLIMSALTILYSRKNRIYSQGPNAGLPILGWVMGVILSAAFFLMLIAIAAEIAVLVAYKRAGFTVLAYQSRWVTVKGSTENPIVAAANILWDIWAGVNALCCSGVVGVAWALLRQCGERDVVLIAIIKRLGPLLLVRESYIIAMRILNHTLHPLNQSQEQGVVLAGILVLGITSLVMIQLLIGVLRVVHDGEQGT